MDAADTAVCRLDMDFIKKNGEGMIAIVPSPF